MPATTHITAYTDGSYREKYQTGKFGGYGAYLEFGRIKTAIACSLYMPKNMHSGYCELTAVLEVLRHIKQTNVPVHIYTDYIQIVNVFENHVSVKKSKPSYPLYKEIAGECLRFPYVRFYYVKGHADHNGNEYAHDLANFASLYYMTYSQLILHKTTYKDNQEVKSKEWLTSMHQAYRKSTCPIIMLEKSIK